MTQDTVLRIERQFQAPVETVFKAFTDPEQIIQWWGPEGCSVPEYQFEVRPGGTFRTCMRGPESDQWVQGEYSEVVENKRLAFSWAWENDGEPGPATYVTVEFHDLGGETNIVLTHEGFDSIEGRDAHGVGWNSSFNCIDQLLNS